MSEHSKTPLRVAPSANLWRAATARRWPLYAGAAVLGLLVIAYVDGVAEPIRPIVQNVALPGSGDSEQ